MTNFFKYWNEVQGGVDGIKLEWKTADNKGTPEGAITAYKELRDNFSPQIYVAIEDYYLAGIRDMINQDGSTIVTTSPMDPRFYVPPQHFFSIAISSADGLAGYAKWLKETYKGSTPLKLGILYWDFASGEMAVNMAKPYIAKIGVDSTAVVYKYSDLSLQTPLMRLRDAGVTHIWMLANSSQAAMVIKEMKGLGLTGKIDICFNEMVESDVVISLAGAEAEGCYILRSESPYSDNTEAAQLYTKMWDWAGKKGLWADNRLPLTLQAVIVGAIKQAAADVGKDKIDKAAIYNALNKLTAIDTWGNSKDFGYGQDRRLGVQTMKIAKFTKTGTISASDYIVMPRVFEGIDNK
jgi:ABC-type branched-subunit amino acid transport system substrate-binding protein